MTQPSPQAWDGEGSDPWMPQRLQQQAQVAVGERTIYDDYYARLSAWLVFAGQATMSGVVPSPDAILNLAPRWVQSMTDFVHTSIAEMVGRAYVRVFGPGYRYDNRPFVVDYLARAQNRLVDVPDQTYTLITSQIAEGALAGESIAKIRDRVRESFDVSGTPYWQNRPTVVARTETSSAMNAGRQGAFTEVAFDLGEPFEKMWLATMAGKAATRTRPTHREADGQRVPLDQPFIVGGFPGMFPGAPELPAEEAIQCVPAETLVSYPGLRAATCRWYEGDMVKISFASGDELSITPNHPILRADGVWTPAGLLNEGDHCVRAVGGGEPLGTPDEDGGPAEIGKVYRAAQLAGLTKRIAVTPPDFHGDGSDGHVDAIAIDRGLRIDGKAASDEEVEQFGLTLANAARPGCGEDQHHLMANVTACVHTCTDITHPGFRPHSGGQLRAPLGVEAGHAKAHGLTPTSERNPSLTQFPDDRSSTHADGAGDKVDALSSLVPSEEVVQVDAWAAGGCRLAEVTHPNSGTYQPLVDGCGRHSKTSGQRDGAFSSLVSTTEIVNIERYPFASHVYNLDTGEGWYIANSIFARNCRCTQLILRPGESIDLSGRQMKDL